ncbi:MAG: hypothetical protein JWN08_1748 [Frankiales bacterium]|jgi:hypothetical protein|nr:hypothetical protein [Frankiales bacterium]
MTDARTLNWRFITPELPGDLLLLPVRNERLEGASHAHRSAWGLEDSLSRRYGAVVAPDVTGWLPDLPGTTATRLLERLAAAVRPGGWLYVGMQTRPAAAGPRRMTPVAARRVLTGAGFDDVQLWFPLPWVSCPAFLVPAARGAELDHFLSTAFFPYSDDRSAWRGRARQQALSLASRAALRTPHAWRVRCAPSLALLARRPA